MTIIKVLDKSSYDMKFILSIRLFFCFYFDFDGEVFLRRVAKVYCIMFSTFVVCVMVYTTITSEEKYYLTVLISAFEFVINVIVSYIWQEKCFIKFCQEIRKIDFSLKAEKKFLKTVILVCNFSIIWILLTRIIFVANYCSFHFDDCLNRTHYIISSSFIYTALELSHAPRLIILILTSSRMYLLCKRLEEYVKVKYRTQKEVKMWNDYLAVYWELIDRFDSLKGLIKILIFVNLFCGLPKLLNWMYNILILVKNSEPNADIALRLAEGLQIALMTSLPGVIVGTIESRIGHMKTTLTRQLYLAKDPKEKEDIKSFLEFIGIWPFELRIWRVIPVDMNLPVGLLSLCTTYLIVIVQFYHLFD